MGINAALKLEASQLSQISDSQRPGTHEPMNPLSTEEWVDFSCYSRKKKNNYKKNKQTNKWKTWVILHRSSRNCLTGNKNFILNKKSGQGYVCHIYSTVWCTWWPNHGSRFWHSHHRASHLPHKDKVKGNRSNERDRVLHSLLVPELIGQPVQSFTEPVSTNGMGGLNAPVPVAQVVQPQLICDLGCIPGIGEALLVGEHQEDCTQRSSSASILKSSSQSFFPCYHCCPTKDYEDQSLYILKVVVPQRPDVFFTEAHVPHG